MLIRLNKPSTSQSQIPIVAGAPKESHLEQPSSPSPSLPNTQRATPVVDKIRTSEDARESVELESPISDDSRHNTDTIGQNNPNDPYSNLEGAFGGYVTDGPHPESSGRGGRELDDLLG